MLRAGAGAGHAGHAGHSAVAVADDSEAATPKPEAKAAGAKADLRGPVFAAAVVAAFVFASSVSPAAAPGASSLPWTLDPSGCLGPAKYLPLYLLTVPAKEVLNFALIYLGEKVLKLKRMDDKGDSKLRKLEQLESVDMAYLALNTMVEFIGMNHVISFLLFGPVEHRLNAFCLFNGPVAFMLVMLLNDVIYYPFHLVAHRRSFYPYCHKQHHRQFIPFRGYQDAANQHPFEQMYGFCIFLASLHIISRLSGLHAGAAWVAFLAWAVLNIANHLAFDSSIHLPLPYPAYPHDHQMHHRFPQCNYSTLTTLCDRIFGSFRPYEALDALPPPPEKKLLWYEKLVDPAEPQKDDVALETPKGRPDFVPSPWSLAGLLACLVVATVAIEMYHIGDIPNHHEWGNFAKPTIVLFNLGLLCFAVEKACEEEVQPKKREKERLYTKPRMREAVAPGHSKQFVGGKVVYKSNLENPMPAKPFKRE